MAKDRSLVRASDIGAWAFCSRAWWLSAVQGVQHADPALLNRGTEIHQDHGRRVERASRLHRLGRMLILLGLLIIALIVAWSLLSAGR